MKREKEPKKDKLCLPRINLGKKLTPRKSSYPYQWLSERYDDREHKDPDKDRIRKYTYNEISEISGRGNSINQISTMNQLTLKSHDTSSNLGSASTIKYQR